MLWAAAVLEVLFASLALNHVSPDHAGPAKLLFFCCCGRSLYLSSKSSSVPSGLNAIVLLQLSGCASGTGHWASGV